MLTCIYNYMNINQCFGSWSGRIRILWPDPDPLQKTWTRNTDINNQLYTLFIIILGKICVGFAASTLYLLVQPYPEDIQAVRTKWNARSKLSTAKEPPFLRSSYLNLLIYSGWKERRNVPTNINLAKRRKQRQGHIFWPFLPEGGGRPFTTFIYYLSNYFLHL